MKYDKAMYVGKKVRLYPHDTYKKTAKIVDVDDLGFHFVILSAERGSDYYVGEHVFISHSMKLHLSFM